MNIAEIRTRVHQLLQRPLVLSHCKRPDNTAPLRNLLECLAADELKHVAYTAQLIEEYAQRGWDDDVRMLFNRRIKDFNELTLRDFEAGQFEVS